MVDGNTSLKDVLNQQRQEQFTIDKGPPWRFTLVKDIKSAKLYLIIEMHHALLDAAMRRIIWPTVLRHMKVPWETENIFSKSVTGDQSLVHLT